MAQTPNLVTLVAMANRILTRG